MMEDTIQGRRQAQINGQLVKKFDFPDPIYPNVINIGNVNGMTLLEQVLDQLVIKEENFIYWTSKDKVKVMIPPELYTCKIQQPSDILLKDKKNVKIKGGEATTLLTTNDPKVLITQSQVYVFFLNSRHDVENEFQIEGEAIEVKEDLHQERIEVIESQHIVEVRDVQVYEIMDFEFIQRL